MKGFVYKITNTKTKLVYIGSTIQTLQNRFKAHRSNARIGKKGKLYDHMRLHGIQHFSIQPIEECEVETLSELGQKETVAFNSMQPELNMKAPNIVEHRSTGTIYKLVYIPDESLFYIGSTVKPIWERLSDHRAAALNGTTPLYTCMRENGRDNFDIQTVEDDVPISDLISRENHWIHELKPTLNKNTELCITEQERDRRKYSKNRDKRLKQVHDRLVLKRDEINAQKRVHYQANRSRIAEQDKQMRIALREMKVVPFTEHPHLQQDDLAVKTRIELISIAKQLGLHRSLKCHKHVLINDILQTQDKLFS
jgi:hypothetical protein